MVTYKLETRTPTIISYTGGRKKIVRRGRTYSGRRSSSSKRALQSANRVLAEAKLALQKTERDRVDNSRKKSSEQRQEIRKEKIESGTIGGQIHHWDLNKMQNKLNTRISNFNGRYGYKNLLEGEYNLAKLEVNYIRRGQNQIDSAIRGFDKTVKYKIGHFLSDKKMLLAIRYGPLNLVPKHIKPSSTQKFVLKNTPELEYPYTPPTIDIPTPNPSPKPSHGGRKRKKVPEVERVITPPSKGDSGLGLVEGMILSSSYDKYDIQYDILNNKIKAVQSVGKSPVYHIYTKLKGKRVRVDISPLKLDDAINFGSFSIDNNLSRKCDIVLAGSMNTFGVIPSSAVNYLLSNRHKFLIKPNRRGMSITEKSKYFLDTIGEKSQIRRSRKKRKIIIDRKKTNSKRTKKKGKRE